MEQMAMGKWVVDPGCRGSGTTEEKVAGWFLLGRNGFRPLEAAGFGAASVWVALNRSTCALWQQERWLIHLASQP